MDIFSTILRSSRPNLFCEKGVLRTFANFTGKHLRQTLFFNKVAGNACNFIQKETLAQVFSCEVCEISKKNLFYRTPPTAASVFYILVTIQALDKSAIVTLAKNVEKLFSRYLSLL